MSEKIRPALDISAPEHPSLSMRPAVVGTLWVLNDSWDDVITAHITKLLNRELIDKWDDDYDQEWQRGEEETVPRDIAARKVAESGLTVTDVGEMIHFEGHSGISLDDTIKNIVAGWEDVNRVAHISAYEFIPEDSCLSLTEYSIRRNGEIREKEVHYLGWTKENVIKAGFIPGTKQREEEREEEKQ